MKLDYYDLLIITGYFIALAAIGFFRIKKGKSSQNDYILYGRKLSLPGFIATLVSTWYGAILGIGENTYMFGIQTWFIFAFPYYVFAGLYAVWLSEKIWKTNLLSIPDIFRKNYGPQIGIISACLIFVLSSPAPYILSLGVLLKFFFNIDILICLVIASVFSTVYVWNGGLSAIVKTDYFQLLLMFIGFILLVTYSWIESVSPIELYRSIPNSHTDPMGGQSIQYISVWFFIAIWTVIDPSFFQRCSAVNSPKNAKKGLLLSIIFWFVFDILTITAGLYAYIFIAPENPLMTYPLLALKVLPTGILGIFIISLFAIIMSTIDSLSFVNAITFGRDIVWRFRKKDAKKNPVYLIKRSLIAVAILSITLSILVPSVVMLFYTLGSIIIPGLILPFINALTKNNKGINNYFSALWLILPVSASFFWFLVEKFTVGILPDIEPFYPGILISVFFYLILMFSPKNNKIVYDSISSE
jgi:SSS family solute:Na+ symporter